MNSFWYSPVWRLFLKEWRTEWRGKQGLLASGLFALLATVAIGLSIPGERVSPVVAAALIAILLLFTACLALPRVFLVEEDQGTLPLLRVNFTPASIFLGKLAFNLITLGLAALVLTPILIGFLEAPVERPPTLVLGIASFTICLAGAVSFCSALVVGASNRWIIVVVLAIPLLVPTVFLAVDAIRSGLGSGSAATGWRAVIGLAGYGLALGAVAPILVEAVWGRD